MLGARHVLHPPTIGVPGLNQAPDTPCHEDMTSWCWLLWQNCSSTGCRSPAWWWSTRGLLQLVLGQSLLSDSCKSQARGAPRCLLNSGKLHVLGLLLLVQGQNGSGRSQVLLSFQVGKAGRRALLQPGGSSCRWGFHASFPGQGKPGEACWGRQSSASEENVCVFHRVPWTELPWKMRAHCTRFSAKWYTFQPAIHQIYI